MRRRIWSIGILVVVLALVLGVGLSQAQGPKPGSEVQPQGDLSVAASVSSRISYQGVLKEDGRPVTGSRDMTFALYSDDACTTLLGSEINATVPITNGVFNVELNFGSTYFDGRPVWLGVEVGTTQVGCQEVLPVPYALSLRPGAQVVGEIAASYILYARNDSTSNYSRGIYGETKSRWLGSGVLGFADSSTEFSYGVEGRNSATSGGGVRGYASASTGYTCGVCGVSDSTSGYGVSGYATADTGTTYGVYGKADSADGYGGYFYNPNGTAIAGLAGGSSGHGLYVKSNGNGRDGAALFADAEGTDGIAIWGYAQGDDSTMVLEHKAGGGDFIRAFQTDPSNLRFKVDVSGNVYADGTYGSPASDFAEMLPAVDGLEPGDVLVIGPDGKLSRSTTPYATNVAGVYSTRPGFVGGSSEGVQSAGKVPLAVVGVVPVKACTENGPIQPGDLLVSSSTPGCAMKAGPNPPVGTVIGKALEGLEEGTDVIKMLVMLQ